jgi:hypothetical protein
MIPFARAQKVRIRILRTKPISQPMMHLKMQEQEYFHVSMNERKYERPTSVDVLAISPLDEVLPHSN